MLAARNFQSGHGQYAASRSELSPVPTSLLHLRETPDQTVQQVLDQVRARGFGFSAAAFNRFQNGFGHFLRFGYALRVNCSYQNGARSPVSRCVLNAFEKRAYSIPDTGKGIPATISLARGGSRERWSCS